MATLSSHTLSSVDGTHAGGVSVSVVRLSGDGAREVVLESVTDDGGRFKADIEISANDVRSEYELVFGTGHWFATQNLPQPGTQIVSEIVIRFVMPDPNGHYHIPVIIGPNGYSTWWSS